MKIEIVFGKLFWSLWNIFLNNVDLCCKSNLWKPFQESGRNFGGKIPGIALVDAVEFIVWFVILV